MLKFLRVRSIVSLSLLALCAACTSKKNENTNRFASQPSVQAPDLIEQSFQVKDKPAKNERLEQDFSGDTSLEPTTDKVAVSISKTALEKEFLLQASLIPQQGAATGSALKSRVVAFRQRGEKLYLLEATPGHTVTTELPQALLLAEFPVINQDKEQITFDFNAGMSKIFVYSDWHAQDDGATEYEKDAQFQSMPVSVSYLEDAQLTPSNQLVIRQIAQAQTSTTNTPFEVRYYLSPYRPDPDFTPTVSRDLNMFGFFELAPQYGSDGGSVIYATKFHSKKPIVFAISDNTPAEYKEAVRDGVLYWNQAFGKEILQVVDAPAGARAPDADYNIVQWVTWDKAGFAYADANMDPRNGQTLHAQVFMTSVFGFIGKERARRILAQLQANVARPAKISLRGFISPDRCNLDASKMLIRVLQDIVQSDGDAQKILKASQDYVREVVAHEIGHTLGLRHNFAGSLATNFALQDRTQLVKSYFDNNRAPEGIVSSSSVMEYEIYEESLFTGDEIARRTGALSYDNAAIRRLYYDEKFQPEQVPPFCTDSQEGKLADCNTFDTGNSVVEYAGWNLDKNMETVANSILTSYVAAKVAAQQGGEMRTNGDSLKTWATTIAESMKFVYKAMSADGEQIKYRYKLPWGLGFQSASIHSDELNGIAADLTRFGGMEQALTVATSDFKSKMRAKLQKWIAAGRNGIYYDGKLYTLTEAEQKSFLDAAETLLEPLFNEVARAEIAMASKVEFSDHALTDDLATYFAKRTDDFVFAATDAKIDGKLPKFRFPFDIRKSAMDLLKPGRSESVSWGFMERRQITSKMEELIKSLLGEAKPETLPKDSARWLLENQKINDVW